jgi:1,4-alpha-glucan branching enzyme
LLLESSDWTFLITTNQAREYGYMRFSQHYENFKTLVNLLNIKEPSLDNFNFLKKLEEKNSLFPIIDYKIFKRRELDEK